MQHPASYSPLTPHVYHTSEDTPLHIHVEKSLKAYLSTSGQPIRGLYNTVLSAIEPTLLKVILEFAKTQGEAARMLGLSRVTLKKKLRQYEVKR